MKQKLTGLELYLTGKAEFQYFVDGNFWYKTNNGSFLFPVPLDVNTTRKFQRLEITSSLREYIEYWFKLVG